jgi:hypothetical protein
MPSVANVNNNAIRWIPENQMPVIGQLSEIIVIYNRDGTLVLRKIATTLVI